MFSIFKGIFLGIFGLAVSYVIYVMVHTGAFRPVEISIVDGPESAETIVFLQGWPDDATLWAPQVAALLEADGRYDEIQVHLDLAGIERVVQAQRS